MAASCLKAEWRIEEVTGALEAIRMTLDILGPPTLGLKAGQKLVVFV